MSNNVWKEILEVRNDVIKFLLKVVILITLLKISNLHLLRVGILNLLNYRKNYFTNEQHVKIQLKAIPTKIILNGEKILWIGLQRDKSNTSHEL